VILSGLLRTVAVLLVGGLVLFDGGAVAINHIQLEETARVAARAGAGALAGEGSHAVREAVVERLEQETGMTLADLTIERGQVAVTVARPAAVLVLDRVRPLASYAQGSASAAASPKTG